MKMNIKFLWGLLLVLIFLLIGSDYLLDRSSGTGSFDTGSFGTDSLDTGSITQKEVPEENADSSPASSGDSPQNSISRETLDYYLNLTPTCTYTFDSGMEYRMTAVDRALGSSFFVLIGTDDGGMTCSFFNPDPYCGSGGEAKWLYFLDENLGFSCLTCSGGAYGLLYRTEDGGASFTQIEYPSAQVKLPDGTLYNPFLMPEAVYEQDGALYLLAGQGPDGDYYGEQGWCSGLYRSEDRGLTWHYVGEVAVEDTRSSF